MRSIGPFGAFHCISNLKNAKKEFYPKEAAAIRCWCRIFVGLASFGDFTCPADRVDFASGRCLPE